MQKTWLSSAHRGHVKENMHENTLSAFLLAARMGADLIETDARMTRDGVLICNHDADVRGFDASGAAVTLRVSETDAETVKKTILAPLDPAGVQYVPTLAEALHLCYHTGMLINIDLKEGITHAEEVARLVLAHGMRGRTIYATNGAGADAIKLILRYDPDARFIDKVKNYTAAALSPISDYPRRCFAYTADFSEENIAAVRESGCMLATISLDGATAPAAFRHHPDMAEYLHTSDFAAIDREIAGTVRFF